MLIQTRSTGADENIGPFMFLSPAVDMQKTSRSIYYRMTFSASNFVPLSTTCGTQSHHQSTHIPGCFCESRTPGNQILYASLQDTKVSAVSQTRQRDQRRSYRRAHNQRWCWKHGGVDRGQQAILGGKLLLQGPVNRLTQHLHPNTFSLSRKVYQLKIF